MFYVGQKVVCVDDSPDLAGRAILVQTGQVYTISDVFEHFGSVGLRFEEVSTRQAPGWHATRFRPVVERKTDISIFKAMLNPKTVETVR